MTNGTFNFELKYGIVVLMRNATDLCSAVRVSNETCPMNVGNHVLGMGFVVPSKSPPVSVYSIVLRYNLGKPEQALHTRVECS